MGVGPPSVTLHCNFDVLNNGCCQRGLSLERQLSSKPKGKKAGIKDEAVTAGDRKCLCVRLSTLSLLQGI